MPSKHYMSMPCTHCNRCINLFRRAPESVFDPYRIYTLTVLHTCKCTYKCISACRVFRSQITEIYSEEETSTLRAISSKSVYFSALKNKSYRHRKNHDHPNCLAHSYKVASTCKLFGQTKVAVSRKVNQLHSL